MSPVKRIKSPTNSPTTPFVKTSFPNGGTIWKSIGSFWIRCLLLSVAFFLFECGTSLKDKLNRLQKEERYEEMLLLCLSDPNSQTSEETKLLCRSATEKTALSIDKILSEKTELPFSQISVDPEWKERIETILQNDPELKSRYGNLWKKMIQND